MLDLPLGAGGADVDPRDGTVVRLHHPARPEMAYLLDEAGDPWHTSEQRWGKGFAITEAGGARWDAPAEIDHGADGVRARHDLGGGLALEVERRFGAAWTERYSFRNDGAAPLGLLTIGIYAPLRDVYRSAADSLRRAAHAHVWTGGAHSWLVAQPMDGRGPVLGMRVTDGALWAYSVESRELPGTGSDARGHLVLHPTDAGRAPHAFGGQPEIALGPGAAHVLAWEIGWYDDVAAFAAAHPPPVETGDLSAETGAAIAFRVAPGVTVTAEAVRRDGEAVRSDREGEAYVELHSGDRRSRVALAWHAPLREIARRRVRYILDHQRARHRAGTAAGALLPVDTEHRLTVPGAAWPDYTDARERIGMGLLFQQVLARGWADDPGELADALAAYRRFVLEHVLTEHGGARSGSHQRVAGGRLYDLPWLMLFLLGGGDLDRAHAVFERYYADGGERFLAIAIGVAGRDLVAALRAAGREEEAQRAAARLVAHARGVAALGDDLPAHEVSYEQSMVAPLIELLCVAAKLSGGEDLTGAIAARLPSLLAFGGPQPHVRMRDIAIRHWDGFWFGRDRLWGDTFPHYWSALTANVLMLLPPAAAAAVAELRGCSARALARRIYAANLIDFRPDGAATAAFVMPSCVSGRPAHRADPIANDQDWALFWPLYFDGLSEPAAAARG